MRLNRASCFSDPLVPLGGPTVAFRSGAASPLQDFVTFLGGARRGSFRRRMDPIGLFVGVPWVSPGFPLVLVGFADTFPWSLLRSPPKFWNDPVPASRVSRCARHIGAKPSGR